MALANLTAPTQGAATAARPKPDAPDRTFFAEACSRRTRLRFRLRDGQHIDGVVCAFGTYTLDVEASGARMLLFKHGVDAGEARGLTSAQYSAVIAREPESREKLSMQLDVDQLIEELADRIVAKLAAKTKRASAGKRLLTVENAAQYRGIGMRQD